MSLPVPRASSPLGTQRSVKVAVVAGEQRRPHERMLAFGALTVGVVEHVEVGGYPPERMTVTLGGRALKTIACGYDRETGRRWVETEVGLVVVPSADDRMHGGCLTVNDMPIPGS